MEKVKSLRHRLRGPKKLQRTCSISVVSLWLPGLCGWVWIYSLLSFQFSTCLNVNCRFASVSGVKSDMSFSQMS